MYASEPIVNQFGGAPGGAVTYTGMVQRLKAPSECADMLGMQDRRSEIRMLCADMVGVAWTDRSGRLRRATALLEDIARLGACLQFEYPIPTNTELHITCADDVLDGTVCYCVYREIGYFVGVKFAPGVEWSRLHYEPQHLLDLEEITARAKTRGPGRVGKNAL